MSDFASIVALSVDGWDVSLREALRELKVADQLIDAFRPVIEARIIERAVQERGIAIRDEDLQPIADAYRAEHDLYTAADTHAWLEEQILSVAQFERRLRDRCARELVQDDVTADQIEPWFAEHRTEFDTAVVSLIVVRERSVAEELAAQVRDEGADFAELARKHSEDEATRQRGGMLGRVNREELSPALQAAVFNARPGEVVGPIETDGGFGLIRVEELRLGELTEEIREEIGERLFQKWMAEQYERAEVGFPLLGILEDEPRPIAES
ncbi:MAG: peptidylprolyl isomerase [Planctomycetes bacterium]|nr:peptidylprolyl isomerase [Planctomycetota bacterium]